MKIAYEKMNTVIEVNVDCVSSLVVENPKFLYQMAKDLKKTIMEESESGIVISQKDEPVSAFRKVALVTDFIGFSLNQKSLLTKMLNELGKLANTEMYIHESHKLLAEIENYIMELTLHFPCELIYEKLSVQNLLKSAGLSIAEDYETLEEKVLTYMDLAREFEGKELFILLNFRCLVSPESLQLMMDTALEREHRILLIDNMEYPRLEREKRIIFDSDFCEI